MLRMKSPIKATPKLQKGKMRVLMDCFQENPYSQYKVAVYRGVLQTVIDGNENKFISEESENENMNYMNKCQGFDEGSNKKVGLFANIIRNIEAKKAEQQRFRPIKEKERPKGYTYYFTELNPKNQKQDNSHDNNGKVGQASIEQDHFECIELEQQSQKQKIKDNEAIPHKPQPFVDLNFSFDEIGKQIRLARQSAQSNRIEHRNEEDTIINKYLNENSAFDGENSKKEMKLSNGSKAVSKQSFERPVLHEKQSLNFAKLSKECKINDIQLPPVPLKHKNSFQKTSIKQSSALQGTKKVQSRIVSGGYVDNVQIDFDLDINFI